MLGFTDGSGKLVGTQKRIALEPGQFDFVDLDPAQVLGPAGGRATIRPVLLSAGGSMEGCQASAHVFEQSTG